MRELSYYRKNETGLLAQYMDSIIDASGLVKDIDFDIVSMIVMDNEFDTFSLGGFLGSTSNKIFKSSTGFLEQAKNVIKEQGKEKDLMWVAPTQNVVRDNVKFYKIKGGIDYDLAAEVGLGVVSYKDEFMIYSPQGNDDPMDVVHEMIKLKVYLQLMHPENVDMKLKESFDKNAHLIQSLMLINHCKHMDRLGDILSYDGGIAKETEEKLEKPKLNRTERITSGDILYILTFLNGRKVERYEALKFLKNVDDCILDDVQNGSLKAIYTASKQSFFKYVNSKYTKLLENRDIRTFQELDDYANQYVINHF
ncbi:MULTISPECIES: hypothetical protein [Paenibacillus]|uniref:Uncharacterized protein n=1 Tax=Paenibacillus urinalis TaxID=521520 RepID=A0AAX3N0R9_9BACL|nr:hypothetical protein [Paenibacillus urinalis]WDH83345.1 hypothetical protein PUW23_03615 [Paenibacillus urinalis]